MSDIAPEKQDQPEAASPPEVVATDTPPAPAADQSGEIAALQQQVASLQQSVAAIQATLAAVPAGQVIGQPVTDTTTPDPQARISELQAQGMSEEDAIEQAAYEQRLRDDRTQQTVASG